MLLIRKVSGPVRAYVGSKARYRVTAYSEPDPSPEDRRVVNWLVEVSNQTLHEFPAAGEVLEYLVPESLALQTIRVMPYLRQPTPRVSVVTTIAVPASEVAGPEPPPGAPLSPKIVRLEQEGRNYFASIDQGPRFFVGADVRYGDRRGLMNTKDQSGAPFAPGDYREAYGFWADFIYPTALCESQGYFQRLNTYDRARFTFGFLQLAAHTPQDNFVLLLREILKLPAAPSYFPDLTVQDGAVHRLTDHGLVRLESPTTTEPLMDYLNPRGEVVDKVEVINGAKFIHWSQHDPQHRACQVAFTLAAIKRKMQVYAKKYGLHGMVDTVCLVVTDIRHQGRAKSHVIIEALESQDPLENLLSIGEETYAERIRTLGAAVAAGVEGGILNQRKYDLTRGDFVPL